MPLYAVTPVLGLNLNEWDDTQRVPLGTKVALTNGGDAVYCVSSGALSQYGLAGINEDFDVYMMTTALAAQSDKLGFPQIAASGGRYLWVPTGGSDIKVRTKASAAADTQLWTTASAGVVDDATSANALKLDGIVLVATAGSAGNGAAGIEIKASWPAIRET